MTASVGIDIGSTVTKGALWLNGELSLYMTPTGWTPEESGKKAAERVTRLAHIKNERLLHITATGYGRNIFSADKKVTEITCHAAGAHFLVPEAVAVLDIGGQDSKAIRLDSDGKVSDFVMNDKCAAGTGRFLQNMAVHLGCSLDDFAQLDDTLTYKPINSMCTVFAESEVVGLLAGGVSKEAISLALLDSVAERAANLLSRVSDTGPVCFTGGCARNSLLASIIERKIKRRVIAPEKAQYAGAIGAALIGAGL